MPLQDVLGAVITVYLTRDRLETLLLRTESDDHSVCVAEEPLQNFKERSLLAPPGNGTD